jgi:hypothetical protein
MFFFDDLSRSDSEDEEDNHALSTVKNTEQ